MEKVKSLGGQLLIVTAGVLIGMKLYEYLNKPKIAAPVAVSTADNTSTGAAPATT